MLRAGLVAIALVGAIVIFAVALAAPDDLEGETWVVTELVVDGSPTSPLDATTMTIQFEDGTATGVAGCNSFFGGYELDGSSISMGPLASTQAFCGEPEGLMDQEVTYLSLMEEADRFERSGDELTLLRGEMALITYQAAPPE